MELIVDNFAGGGGASTGILWATGRHPDIAVNHDPEAIACHTANHPTTRHYLESVWDVDPVEACAGRPVGLAWFSPDCTHFSRAKGAAPVSDGRRGLAWVTIRWAKAVKPRVIVLENVEEFKTWGPLTDDGKPCRKRAGETFGAWLQALEELGYVAEFRTLHAHHYGAPTTRKRLFMVARCDGQPTAWPAPTHSDLPLDGLLQYRTAFECIDWSIPGESVYNRKRPLSASTMERVERGVHRFIVEGGEQHFLAKHYTGVVGHDLHRPLGTITTVDHHSLVTAFLVAYYGSEAGSDGLDKPLRTVTTVDRFGIVMVHGQPHKISDVTMRMLQPHELAAAQGFPADYDWGNLPKRTKVRLIGNSVCPHVAAAIVRANYS